MMPWRSFVHEANLAARLVFALSIVIRLLDHVQVAPRPIDRAGFGPKTAIALEKAVNHILAAKAGGDAQVMNGGTAPNQQIDDVTTVPIQCLLERRPAAGAVDRRAAIQQQRGRRRIVAAAAGAERPIEVSAGVNQYSGQFDLVRRVPRPKDQTLEQRRMTRR